MGKKHGKVRRVQPLFIPDGVYTHEQIMRALGVGPEAWRRACKRGLKHGQIARRLLVTGRQLAEFVEALGEQNAAEPAKPQLAPSEQAQRPAAGAGVGSAEGVPASQAQSILPSGPS